MKLLKCSCLPYPGLLLCQATWQYLFTVDIGNRLVFHSLLIVHMDFIPCKCSCYKPKQTDTASENSERPVEVTPPDPRANKHSGLS